MARKRERAFALFGAGLFLLTSSALTIAVVYSMVQQHDSTSAATNTSASTANCSLSADLIKAKEQPMATTGKLQGTKLENFTPIDCITDLKSVDTVVGTGAVVTASDTITVDYTGAVASTGVIFQSSKDTGQPATFPLNGVIAGWTQGIPGMKVGGTRRLFIPASLAYGANPPSGSGIPANADLVFDVTVHSISPPQAQGTAP
jgi:FKBP-type peptidyl-prolyl cis-trans isomerase